MTNLQYKTISIILCAVVIAVLTAGNGFCQSEEEIFIWTGKAFGVDANITMPEVHWVGQVDLQNVFVKNNQAAYMRWQNKHGVAQAREIMDQYLSDIVGLYSPKTNIVYVGTFLDACRKEAILAHEFTHFFQQFYEGEVTGWGEESEATMRMVREMEAYKIESLYQQILCQTNEKLDSDSD
jgi:hypothetical protein